MFESWRKIPPKYFGEDFHHRDLYSIQKEIENKYEHQIITQALIEIKEFLCDFAAKKGFHH